MDWPVKHHILGLFNSLRDFQSFLKVLHWSLIFLFRRVIQEPWIFVEAHRAYQNGTMDWQSYGNLTKNIINFFRQIVTEHIILILPIFCTPIITVMAENCPSIKHIFSTRRHPLMSIEDSLQVRVQIVLKNGLS